MLRRPPGVALILGATAIASVAGYLVIWLVPLQVGGFAEYRAFGLFWAAMYFVVGSLAGIQQEITRATSRRPAGPASTAATARNFGLACAGLVFVAVLASSPLWVGPVFDGDGWLALPLAFAAASYVLVATLAGTLYGISGWGPLALMIAVDAVLRVAFLLVAASFTADAVILAWAAAVPFLLTIVVLWPVIRRESPGETDLDVGHRALSWNVARTLVASASAGALVSGLPVVIQLAATVEPAAFVAGLFTVITIARAPVIVVVVSLQSYLVVHFRDSGQQFWRRFVRIQSVVLVGSAVLGGLAWVVGPIVIEILYGDLIAFDGWVYAVLVASSGLVGSLVVSATANLARADHFAYSTGWLVAALATFACFVLPGDLLTKTTIALLAGPVAGLAVHAGFLAARRRVSQPAA